MSDLNGYIHIQRKDSLSNFSLTWKKELINTFYIIAKILEKNNADLNRFFKSTIRANIADIIIFTENNDEKKELFSKLSDFEKDINFNANLPIGFNLINYFILHRNFTLTTYMALIFSKLLKSNLIENMYKKLVLKNNK